MVDAPEISRARRVPAAPSLRRDPPDPFDDADFAESLERRRGGLRVTVRGGVPKSIAGRIFAGLALVTAIGAFVAGAYGVRRYLLNNDRFVIESSSAIQIIGNSHLSRAQLLSVFGEDVERNILTVSLAQRRAELEQLPWVEHATVMRLLPDKLRVSVVERTPVAFVRDGGRVGLVDRNGVLLDLASADAEEGKAEHYSFPVVTGLSATDAPSTRAARMKLYRAFTADLDSSGTKISDKLSEVDLSNPEDVKALIPEGSSEILVHFGEDRFLERYRKFEQNLPKWRQDYPKLASADMRYDRQVVLEMQPAAAPAEPVARDEAKPAPLEPARKDKALPKTKGPGAKSQAPAAKSQAPAAKSHAPAAKPHPQAGPR